jgi:hypothetical protein
LNERIRAFAGRPVAGDEEGRIADLESRLQARSAESHTLLEECRKAESRVGALAEEALAEARHWRSKHDALQSGLAEARQAGMLVEFDYPYRPRVRTRSGIPGGDPLAQLLEDGRQRYGAQIAAFARFTSDFSRIAGDLAEHDQEPFWNNPWLPPLDAVALYALIAGGTPRTFLEVGSGNSTKFARRAIADHGLGTRIVSIDPQPRAFVDRICDDVIRAPLEDADLDVFARLQPGDLVFIDNSHRSFQNSDVTVFFTEVLPRLPPGVIWGLHDIFLPNDYPAGWEGRFYNEQYLLSCYLLGGAGGDRIEFPAAYVAGSGLLQEAAPGWAEDPPWGDPQQLRGGSFWMLRGGEP